MNHWLVKSEPNKYSWDHLVKEKEGMWDGVRNFAARNNLMAMKKGDLVLFYHSNIGKEVVGLAKVSKEHYPDPTIDTGDWVVVNVAIYAYFCNAFVKRKKDFLVFFNGFPLDGA